MAEAKKIPVTVVTGFLGAGKTTLVNYILKENHGFKIAVIENEYGEIGIDEQLVDKKIKADEELFSMDNGCLCCTVRGDLVRTLTQIVGGDKKFDAIVVETTGLADPAPIAQTFFATPELQDALQLDAILCVVDAKHVQMHLDDKKDVGTTNEAVEQIAFADKILLNKTDLPEEKAAVRGRIKRINAACEIMETTHSRVSLDKLLGLDTFNLKRVLEMMPSFLEGAADAQEHDPTCTDEHCIHKDHCHDADCKDHHHHHHHHHEEHGHGHDHDHGEPKKQKTEEGGHGHGHHHGPSHKHDDKVSSVGLKVMRELDGRKLNRWMSNLLGEKGDDLFRSKGVLAVKDQDEKMIFQGVHTQMTMATSGQLGCPAWLPGEPRISTMVFIGRHLDRHALQADFDKCAWTGSPYPSDEEDEEDPDEELGDDEQ